MSKCAVLNCKKSRYRAGKTNVQLIIHSFPQQEELFRTWVKFCRQSENWLPSAYFGICSYHFKNEDYQMENTSFVGGRKRSRILCPNSVPSIFESPPYSECTKKEQACLPKTTDVKIEPIYSNTDQDVQLYESDIRHEPDSMLQKYREQFCRTCLNRCQDVSSISVDSQMQNVTVLDMLIQLTGFETENNDAFPTVICVECKDKLEHAFNIRQEFIAQSEHLVQLVAEEKILDYFTKASLESGEFLEPLSNEESIHEMYDTSSNDVSIKEENGSELEFEVCDLNAHANCLTESAVVTNSTDGREDTCVRGSTGEIEVADKPTISEPEVQRTQKTASDRTRRKKVSTDNVSLTSEEAWKRKMEMLRERARGYSMASNRKRYKLEAEAQKRYPFTTCYICDKTHATLMERDFHMREHIPLLPYHCYECSSTTEKDESQSAEDTVKGKPIVLRTMSQLNAHFRMHSLPHKCDKCYRRFCTSLKLKTHNWSSHGIAEKGLTCEYCGKQYFQRTIFNRHVAYHRNEINGQFKCTICDRSMGSKSSLRRHEASHKGEKKYKCMYCDKLFSTSYNRLTHHRVVHTGERPHKCKECGRGFVDNSRLKIHQELHEKAKTGMKDVIRKSILLAPGKELCPYSGCDYTAITYRAMYLHKRKVHMSVYTCDVCLRSFAFEYDLKSHMMLHTGEKPFKCTICDRSFRRSAMYRRHQQTHVPDDAAPAYTCTICQKSFKMARYLQAHKLTHSTEKNFACDACRSSFKTKGELTKHRRYKHGIETTEAIIETTEAIVLKTEDAQGEEYYITEVIE